MNSRGEIPSAIRACIVAIAKSPANCATSAASSTSTAASPGAGAPRRDENEHGAE